jgi:ABC-type nickel/cobalt efflux system permease component RcnA
LKGAAAVANAFETVILKMRDLGMFQFLLPFMLTATIFYGLLRKSKIFGEEFRAITVNAVVALVAAFMVWAAPIILGVNIETGLAAFFLQGMSATLILLVGLMMTSMFFPPDLAAEARRVQETWRGSARRRNHNRDCHSDIERDDKHIPACRDQVRNRRGHIALGRDHIQHTYGVAAARHRGRARIGRRRERQGQELIVWQGSRI